MDLNNNDDVAHDHNDDGYCEGDRNDDVIGSDTGYQTLHDWLQVWPRSKKTHIHTHKTTANQSIRYLQLELLRFMMSGYKIGSLSKLS